MVQECWHRECYMIHKFWNVKVAVLPTRNLQSSESAAYVQEEAEYNSITLKERQTDLEALVYRIWTQLSAFEESAAACVSDTIRHVGDEMYIDAIRAAEKFVLHVEVLFAVIDELEAGFTAAAVGGLYGAVLSRVSPTKLCLLDLQGLPMFEKRGCYAPRSLQCLTSCRVQKIPRQHPAHPKFNIRQRAQIKS
ncbi:hypothetical protein FRC00_004760 [Tulasnella sp. 408]|nr:hypothetical protein FRC00_004760 [Tulasnella sp. 408]